MPVLSSSCCDSLDLFLHVLSAFFCLDSYLALLSDFGVHHCECQSDLLLVLQGTVGAQKIVVVGNTIQVLLQFSSGVSLPKIMQINPNLVIHWKIHWQHICQKLSKSAQDQQSYFKNKKGAVFFETQCS